ncbi:MAG TPA: TRAP transporter small permease, partial [Burkholderiales bacterium]|nr:TRAP transporter small permease [Burkholderiales bacterium]
MKSGSGGLALISRAYDAVLYGMAGLAGLLMVAMMTTIFIDVVLRNLGYQSSAHFFTFTEYALLAVPCLGAPWLVREKGHIYVEMFLTSLPLRPRAVAIRLIGALCVVVCAVLGWYGGVITVNDFIHAERDVRSFDMPRWIVVGFIPLSFCMMAIEFVRFLARGENFLGAQSPTDTG